MVIELSNRQKIEYKDEASILEALLYNQVMISNPCSGSGTCGNCKIKVLKGQVTEVTVDEKQRLSAKDLEDGIRLSCSIKPLTDITIEILGMLESEYVWENTLGNYCESKSGRYGIAVDLGTTTVSISLIDSTTKEMMASMTRTNPQVAYGMDVFTRISYENQWGEDGVKKLQEIIVSGIDKMICECCNKSNISIEEIEQMSISANCIMTHMLLGKDARSLGKFPYETDYLESQYVSSRNLGMSLDIEQIYCTPHVSAFVGGDIVAGVNTLELQRQSDTILFIDIGTNGEIVLAHNQQLWCCSCAIGPALEGMNISCGMLAITGAIEDVHILDEDVQLKIIDSESPQGICGSGILATIRELLRQEMLHSSGAICKMEQLAQEDYRRKLLGYSGKKRVIILDEDHDVFVTQQDIRQVQLAKGALRSGIEILLEQVNIKAHEVDRVLIGGQFGAHLPVDSLITIGMLPNEFASKIRYVGNTSMKGAVSTLGSNDRKDEMQVLASCMNYIELSQVENYDKKFTSCLRF